MSVLATRHDDRGVAAVDDVRAIQKAKESPRFFLATHPRMPHHRLVDDLLLTTLMHGGFASVGILARSYPLPGRKKKREKILQPLEYLCATRIPVDYYQRRSAEDAMVDFETKVLLGSRPDCRACLHLLCFAELRGVQPAFLVQSPRQPVVSSYLPLTIGVTVKSSSLPNE